MQKIFCFGTNKRRDFYKLWQQHKQLKTMEKNEVWSDIYDEGYIYIYIYIYIYTYIYISILTWTHSQNSVPAVEAPSWKISSHEISLKWSRRPLQSAQKYSQTLQWKGASPFEFKSKSIETETTASEFLNGEKTTVEPILASEERNKSKRAGLWESCQVYQLHQNRPASPYDGR